MKNYIRTIFWSQAPSSGMFTKAILCEKSREAAKSEKKDLRAAAIPIM